MFNKYKNYIIGLVTAAMLTAAGVFYAGVDKVILGVEEAGTAVIDYVTGPEVGSPEWFTLKKDQLKTQVEVIKNQRHMLANAQEWNDQVNLRFAIATSVKTCDNMVKTYNEQAVLKRVDELKAEVCDQ